MASFSLEGMNDRMGSAAKITVAIATTSKRLPALRQIEFEEKASVRYLITIQKNTEQMLGNHLPDLESRNDVEVIWCNELGVSKNRNSAIKACTTEFLIFADDDTKLHTWNYDILLQIGHENPETALFVGKIVDANGYPRKRYPKHLSTANHFNSGRIGTPEMMVRPGMLQNKGVEFDEDFGLGTEVALGEEFIFVSDALKAGLTGKFVDVVTCTHGTASSGEKFGDNELKARKQVFERIFGKFSIFARLYFAIKHRSSLGSIRTQLDFIFLR